MINYELEKNINGIVAGVDEAGRGPWAGPVIAAAVILDPNNIPNGINDSKKLSKKKRELLYEQINNTCDIGVGIVEAEEIDEINILQASLLAMQKAVKNLSVLPDMVLVDGNKTPKFNCSSKAIIKGDTISLSIAAGAIIAKVTRDRLMSNLSIDYPEYDWSNNSGYGTKNHQRALAKFGITPHHRKSFKPIKEIMKNSQNDNKIAS